MKKTYYLFNPGQLSRKDNTLKFIPVTSQNEAVESKIRYLPVENIDQLYVFGSLEANSALYNFLGKNEIPVHFFDYYENYTGSFMPKDNLLAGKVILEQVKLYTDIKRRIQLAGKILLGASFNILKNLKYYNKRGKDTDPIICIIDTYRSQIEKANDIPGLMGIEGNIRKIYYEAFDLIINDFSMGGRTYKPPKNEVNALISFGNMLCYSECLRMIHKTQLNPTISFLHEPGYRRYSLALDIAEIFKPIIIDRLIFRLLNKKQIQTKHFESNLNRFILKESGRKIFISAYEERLNETIHHRVLDKKVSYKQLIQLECYKIQKEILSIEKYKPLKMWW